MARGTTFDTNIKLESDSNFSALTNMDTFRDKYKFRVLVIKEDNSLAVEEIITIDLNIPFLELYRYMILASSETKLMKSKWKLRPDYISYEHYQTTSLDFLILFINNVFSIVDFDMEYVIIPSLNVVTELITINMSEYPERNTIKSISFM